MERPHFPCRPRAHRRTTSHERPRTRNRQLSPARLAGFSPTLLGRAYPDRTLRFLWHCTRTGKRATCVVALQRRLYAGWAISALEVRGIPADAMPAVRYRSAARHRYPRYLRMFIVVLLALSRQQECIRTMGSQPHQPHAAGRYVCGRPRTCRDAPPLCALYHACAV